MLATRPPEKVLHWFTSSANCPLNISRESTLFLYMPQTSLIAWNTTGIMVKPSPLEILNMQLRSHTRGNCNKSTRVLSLKIFVTFWITPASVFKANLKYPKVITFPMGGAGTTVFSMNGFRLSVYWKNTTIRFARGNHLAPKIKRKSFLWSQEKRHFTFKEAMIKKKKKRRRRSHDHKSAEFQVYLRHRVRNPTSWTIKQDSINFKQLKFLTIIQLI